MAKQRPSVQKRQREYDKRQRELRKAQKAELKRQRRQERQDRGSPPPGNDHGDAVESDEESPGPAE